jgi:hypothetical protein
MISDEHLILLDYQVISPLLIVYRVAMGRAITPTLQTSEKVKAQIRFNIPPPSEGGEVEV